MKTRTNVGSSWEGLVIPRGLASKSDEKAEVESNMLVLRANVEWIAEIETEVTSTIVDRASAVLGVTGGPDIRLMSQRE